jgi:hypothetical protein
MDGTATTSDREKRIQDAHAYLLEHGRSESLVATMADFVISLERREDRPTDQNEHGPE